MASSSRNATSRSSSPSKRYSRVADAAQVAPYLTHVVKHHGQITLIPPENTARIRKPKKKRPPSRAENSTVSLELPRTPPSRSRPQTPRLQSSTSARTPRHTINDSGSNVQTSGQRSQEYLRIPDFPPPSFEEAMLGTPSPQSMPSIARASDAPRFASAMIHLVTQEPAALANAAASATPSAPPSSPETESLHSESSHSSLEEAGDSGPRSLWEQDIEAGYSLEERVRRESERRRLAESLPHAPVLQPSEQKDVVNDSQSQTNVDDILLAIQQKYREHRLRLEVAAQNDIALATLFIQEQLDVAEPVASSGAEVHEALVPDSGVPESEEPTSHAVRRKGKEKAVHDIKNHDNSFTSDKNYAEGPLSNVREVLNTPLRPQPGPSGSLSEISSPEFTLPSTTTERSASTLQSQSIGACSHTAPTSHSTTTSSFKDASTRTSYNVELSTSSSRHVDHTPVSSPIVSSASLSPVAISSSIPPACSSKRPLPNPPITPPTTPSAFASRRPLPSAASGGLSVRDRISTFESLQSRPIPPPPSLPKIVRRPPPIPVPSSFDRERRFFDARMGNTSSTSAGGLSTCTAGREESGDATMSPFRRRRPPPLPTRAMLDGSVLSQRSGSSGTPGPSSSPSSRVDAVDTTGSATTNDIATPLIEAYQVDAPPAQGQTSSLVDLPASLREDVVESSAQIEPTSLDMAEKSEEGRDAVNPFEGNSLVDTGRSESEVGAPASPQTTSGIAESEPSVQLFHHPLVMNGDTVQTNESHTHVDQEPGISASASQDISGRPNATIEVHNDVGIEPGRTQSSSPTQAENQAPSTTTTLQPLQPVFTGLTDLDLLLARLGDPDFTFNGRSYEDLLLLEEIMGPAIGSNRTQFEDIPLGRVEVLRRRVTKDGRIKLKLALLGVVIDRCGICLVQFKDGVFACLLPCRHAFHERCLRLWMRRGNTCPLCRGPLFE